VLCFFILGVITLNHSLRAEEFDLRGKFMPVQAARRIGVAQSLAIVSLLVSAVSIFICMVQSECGSYVQMGVL